MHSNQDYEFSEEYLVSVIEVHIYASEYTNFNIYSALNQIINQHNMHPNLTETKTDTNKYQHVRGSMYIYVPSNNYCSIYTSIPPSVYLTIYLSLNPTIYPR